MDDVKVAQIQEQRMRSLEATVDRLLDRVDNLERTVIDLCEQDGDVQFTPVRSSHA